MQAIVRTKPGKNFSTMKVELIPSPKVHENELKIKMVSSRINPVDMDLMKGMPFLKYKTPQIGGVDGAGVVVEVGGKVSGFKIGDNILFYRKFSDIGSWAEEITVKAADCAVIPRNISVQDAGAIALPLLTAFESVKLCGARRGETILIHGAGGGVGFQTVLAAQEMGLRILGTANASDEELLRRVGVERVIDYKTQDFEAIVRKGEADYIFDALGGEVLVKSLRLQPKIVVSLKYIDPSKMHKTGVHLPRPLAWVMKQAMRKFDRIASKHNVRIIGQVTGADGKLLQEAIDFIEKSFVARPYQTLNIADIARNGLTANDVGKVIVF